MEKHPSFGLCVLAGICRGNVATLTEQLSERKPWSSKEEFRRNRSTISTSRGCKHRLINDRKAVEEINEGCPVDSWKIKAFRAPLFIKSVGKFGNFLDRKYQSKMIRETLMYNLFVPTTATDIFLSASWEKDETHRGTSRRILLTSFIGLADPSRSRWIHNSKSKQTTLRNGGVGVWVLLEDEKREKRKVEESEGQVNPGHAGPGSSDTKSNPVTLRQLGHLSPLFPSFARDFR